MPQVWRIVGTMSIAVVLVATSPLASMPLASGITMSQMPPWYEYRLYMRNGAEKPAAQPVG